jgi:sugar phosphate isomerase/epimerase
MMNTTPSILADSRLLLSAGTLLNARFKDRVAAAKAAGFDAISLFPQQYLAARRKEKLSINDMQEILAEHAIAMDEVDPLMDWFDNSANQSEQLIYEIAQALGARSINVAPAFVPDISREIVAEKFANVCQRAAAYKLRVDLEFLPWSALPDLAAAMAIVDASEQDNAGVMLDFWHFFHGNNSIEQIGRLSPEQAKRITSIQVSDSVASSANLTITDKLGVAGLMAGNLRDGMRVLGAKQFFKTTANAAPLKPGASALMSETMSKRLLPGQGETAVTQLLQSLEAAGATPTVGIEVFSLLVNKMPADIVAMQAMDGYRQVASRK